MTNTPTADVSATVAQIHALEKAGCEIIRCTVPDEDSAKALSEIKGISPEEVIEISEKNAREMYGLSR